MYKKNVIKTNIYIYIYNKNIIKRILKQRLQLLVNICICININTFCIQLSFRQTNKTVNKYLNWKEKISTGHYTDYTDYIHKTLKYSDTCKKMETVSCKERPIYFTWKLRTYVNLQICNIYIVSSPALKARIFAMGQPNLVLFTT